ncbi:MAG: ABC transporter permease [Acidobacteriota bacterium]
MGAYLIRRLSGALLLLWVILTLTFFLTRIVPGGPSVLYENPRLTQEQIEIRRAQLGLDQPLPEQYFSWLQQVLTKGDWGHSYRLQRPALDVILSSLPHSLVLGIFALALQYGLGIAIGVIAARRAGSSVDFQLRITSLTLYSVPTFWLGLLALMLFHLHLRWLPSGGVASLDSASLSFWPWLGDRLLHLALPATVLGVSAAAGTARFVRNSVLESLHREYIQSARARGLGEGRVLWVHALRNSLLPVVQSFGLSLPAVLNGALVTEVIFSWPGLGRTLYTASVARDYPVILAGTAFGAILAISGSLIADLLEHWLDPRVRLDGD